MENSDIKLFKILDQLEIKYKIYEHDPIKTVKEAIEKQIILPGLNLKNLLIKDKKKENFYLVILEDNKLLDINKFKEVTNTKKISFAKNDELYTLMKVYPGSVGPFGLINDKENKIKVVLDKAIEEELPKTLVNFHPNRNNATIALTKKDFLKYLKYLNKDIIILK